MNEKRGESRTHVEIDGRDFLLPANLDLVDLMSRIEDAARSEPTFVDIAGDGELASVLISPQSRVVVSVEHLSVALPAPEVAANPMLDWDL
jgi:hypothetical protein